VTEQKPRTWCERAKERRLDAGCGGINFPANAVSTPSLQAMSKWICFGLGMDRARCGDSSLTPFPIRG